MVGKVLLSAVGDVTLGNHHLATGFGVRDVIEQNGNRHIFKFVQPLLKSSDLRFLNLEGVLSDVGSNKSNYKSMFFRGAPGFVESLSCAGFNIVNVANNHSLQHGIKAFEETAGLLTSRDIGVVGRACMTDYSSRPVVRQINDLKIGFLGYSFADENFYKGANLYAIGVKENVLEDIRKLKRDVDFVVVSCHWGIELMDRPPFEVIQLARAMVDSGADVILGHHPHVFQAVEEYGRGIIAYSLGNFVSDCIWDNTCVATAIVMIEFQKSAIPKYQLIPIRINSEYQPIPLVHGEGASVLEHMREISKKSYYDCYQDVDDGCARFHVQASQNEARNARAKFLYLIQRLYKIKWEVIATIAWEMARKRVLSAMRIKRVFNSRA